MKYANLNKTLLPVCRIERESLNPARCAGMLKPRVMVLAPPPPDPLRYDHWSRKRTEMRELALALGLEYTLGYREVSETEVL